MVAMNPKEAIDKLNRTAGDRRKVNLERPVGVCDRILCGDQLDALVPSNEPARLEWERHPDHRNTRGSYPAQQHSDFVRFRHRSVRPYYGKTVYEGKTTACRRRCHPHTASPEAPDNVAKRFGG